MGNFNPLNSLFKQLGSLMGQSVGSSGMSSTGSVFSPSSLNNINTILKNTAYLNQQTNTLLRLPLALLMKQEFMNLTAQENAEFMKDLLKLPKELRLLLSGLAMQNTEIPADNQLQQSLRQLLEQNLKKSLNLTGDQLQELLGKNSKDASSQLMKLLQNTPALQVKSGQQVMELVSQMEKLAAKVQESPKHAAETIMLLYLPWYPLQQNQKLDLGFGMDDDGNADEDVTNQEASVVLYIDTNMLGRFKLVVEEMDPLQVFCKIMHQEAGKPALEDLQLTLNEFLASEGLPEAIFTSDQLKESQANQVLSKKDSSHLGSQEKVMAAEDVGGAGFAKATRRGDNKEVSAQQGERVSILVLNCAYTLARRIFELDESQTSLQKKQSTSSS